MKIKVIMLMKKERQAECDSLEIELLMAQR
jgi:hypothetical protein